MSAQPVSPAAIGLLQRARKRVAHGWPSLTHALARTGARSTEEMCRAATALRDAEALGEKAEAPVEVRALAEACRWVEAARALWGFDGAQVPRLAEGEPYCLSELRFLLEAADGCGVAAFEDEDEDGLERGQAVCVLSLALLLVQAEAWSG